MNLFSRSSQSLGLGTALLVLLAACGGGSTTAPTSPTAPAATPAASAPARTAVASAAAAAETVQVFFTAGGKLVPEIGKVQAAEPARGALELLLKGPVASGHYTELPSGIKLEDVALADGTASVSFDPSFYAGGGSTGMQTRLAQVVYTLTQFPTVQNVRFLQDGQPARVAGGEGFPLNRPLTRSSFTAISA